MVEGGSRGGLSVLCILYIADRGLLFLYPTHLHAVDVTVFDGSLPGTKALCLGEQ